MTLRCAITNMSATISTDDDRAASSPAHAYTTNPSDLVGRFVLVLFAPIRDTRSCPDSTIHNAPNVSGDFDFYAFLLAMPSHQCFRSLTAVSGQFTPICIPLIY